MAFLPGAVLFGVSELGGLATSGLSLERPGHIRTEVKDSRGAVAWCRELYLFIFNLAAATEIQMSPCEAVSFHLFSLLSAQPNFCLLCFILGVVGRHRDNGLCFQFCLITSKFF